MAEINKHAQRADSIRSFIQKQSSCNKSEYKAKRFQDLFALSHKHNSTMIGRPSKPGTPKVIITDRSEKAYQRAIFMQRITDAQFPKGISKVSWLDYELPIIPGTKGRRGACDLIAKVDSGITTICEAKYKCPPNKSNGNDADYAVFELLFQLQSVALNAHQFKNNHHTGKDFKDFSWDDIAEAKTAFIVANKSWWKGSRDTDRNRIARLLSDIKAEVGIDILLFQTEDVKFESRQSPYEPKWPVGTPSTWLPALSR